MTTLAVHPWPGLMPPLKNGVFVIGVQTSAQRARARAQIREALQQALAAVLGLAPGTIAIASIPGRPPRIVLAGDARGIGCSFAHENSYALAAVNLQGTIGVDLMRVRDLPDWQTVARDYLGPAASAALLDTSPAERPRAFAHAWTRREAALKCDGQQLSEWRVDIGGPTTMLAIPAPDLVGHIHTGQHRRQATMKSKVVHALILAALCASAAAAECGPDALGTGRTITLKREGALYGTSQHNALPLKKGEVVLTFDDGPSPENTQMVLKALSDQCAKATFFMMGEHIAQAPELARRVVSEGHSAGIHSYTHPHMATLSADEQLADLKKTRDIYRATFGADTPAYRFPFLEETPTLLAALKQARITVASIDLGINDWLPDDTTEILIKRLTESLDKSGLGIILMHDANIPTAKALPALLKVLKDKGYKVVHLEWEK